MSNEITLKPRYSKYAQTRWGGNEYYDDVCLLLNGLAKRCKNCKGPTKLKYLDKFGYCPDCKPVEEAESP